MKETVRDELDTIRVHEIVQDVFQRKGLAPQYSIEFEHRKSKDSKSRAYLEGKTLHIVAGTEAELRRAIGRFVIRHVWSPNDWLLVNHPGLYTLTSLFLLTALPAISYLLAYVFPEVRFLTVVFTYVLIIFFSIWTANQVSRQGPELLREFTIMMADLDCMTEYDYKDYVGHHHNIPIPSVSICIVGVVSSLRLGMTFYIDEFVLLSIPFVVLLPAALCFLLLQALVLEDSDLCYPEDEPEEEEEMEDGFEDNERLQGEFERLIERMDLWSSLKSSEKEEFSKVRARFSHTRYAHCRSIYSYVKNGTLFIDAKDISEDAAIRHGSAVLTKGSLRFYQELSFKRRAIHLVALLFGVFMTALAFVFAYEVSTEFGIGTLVFTCILFTGMWYIGWRQNTEARREFPDILRRTEMLQERDVEFYSHFVFPASLRFDLSFLAGFLISAILIGLLFLVLA